MSVYIHMCTGHICIYRTCICIYTQVMERVCKDFINGVTHLRSPFCRTCSCPAPPPPKSVIVWCRVIRRIQKWVGGWKRGKWERERDRQGNGVKKLSLILPGEVKIYLCIFYIKFRTNFLCLGSSKNLPFPAETSFKYFWPSDMTSKNDVLTSIFTFFRQKFSRGATLRTYVAATFWADFRNRSALIHTCQRPGEVSLHLVKARSKLNGPRKFMDFPDPGSLRTSRTPAELGSKVLSSEF